MCRKWMGAARGANAGWGGEALFLETETRPSHSDKWGAGRWQKGKLRFCLPWDSRVPGP